MIRPLIIPFTPLSISLMAQGQLIPDEESDTFYKYEVDCTHFMNCIFYVSTENDPGLQTYSEEEFIETLRDLYDVSPLKSGCKWGYQTEIGTSFR